MLIFVPAPDEQEVLPVDPIEANEAGLFEALEVVVDLDGAHVVVQGVDRRLDEPGVG